MNQKEKWQLIFVSVVLIGVGILCFFLGRSTIKIPSEKIKVEYVQGPTMHDTIKFPQPYIIERPIDTLDIIQKCIRDGIYAELFPTKIITQYIEITKEDTTGILEDWASKRHYSNVLFDVDTLGKCIVNSDVQYNRLMLVGYEYTPIVKTVTETQYIVKKVSPFVGIGGMLNPWDKQQVPIINVSVGLFAKEKYGLQLQYQHAFNLKYDFLGGNILYKF